MTNPPVVLRSDGSKDYGAMAQAGAGWTLRMDLDDLTFVRVNHQTRLQFDQTEVVIGCAFVVHADGVDHELDPERRGELGPLLAVYPNTLSSASVENDGTLRLGFTSGARIVVPPHPMYEAWHVSGPGTRLIVCVPGNSGELAVWT